MNDQEIIDALAGHEHKDSGSGSSDVFMIEIRTTYPHPTVHEGYIIDNTWREIPHQIICACGGQGIAIRRNFSPIADDRMGGMNFEAAEALRWQALAWLTAQSWGGTLCIETRIVKKRIHYTYRTEEMGVTAPLSVRDYECGQEFKPRRVTEPVRTK